MDESTKNSAATHWQQQVVGELRLNGYAYDTEKAYLAWLRRFENYLDGSPIIEATEASIRGFLTELATERNVAVSTQKQAMSALLFLFTKVLGRELVFLDIRRSDKPVRLPVVFSQSEAKSLAGFFPRSQSADV